MGSVNERSPARSTCDSLTSPRAGGYDRRVTSPGPIRAAWVSAALAAVLALAGLAARAAPRFLVDEVVAVVAAHSITLSEVRAEVRIQILTTHGLRAALLEPDRRLLAATLQQMIDQRLVLSEVESLRTFEVDRAEVEGLLIPLRARCGGPERYEQFTRLLDMTDDEIGQVLARQQRYARYIDSKVKLAGALRKGETEESCAKELGRKPSAPELAACTHRLQLARYRKVTEEVLAELRRRIDVRVIDPLDDAGGAG
jgi:hypothetical protein